MLGIKNWIAGANKKTIPSVLKVGDEFYRQRSSIANETVRVTNLHKDHLGINHVRYITRVDGTATPLQEDRTLSLNSFCERYIH